MQWDYNHNFYCDKKNIPELLQYRSGRHKNDTPEMALQSYTQINVQSTRDPNIYKKVRIWGRVNFAENAVKGVSKGVIFCPIPPLGQKKSSYPREKFGHSAGKYFAKFNIFCEC